MLHFALLGDSLRPWLHAVGQLSLQSHISIISSDINVAYIQGILKRGKARYLVLCFNSVSLVLSAPAVLNILETKDRSIPPSTASAHKRCLSYFLPCCLYRLSTTSTLVIPTFSSFWPAVVNKVLKISSSYSYKRYKLSSNSCSAQTHDVPQQ